MAIYAVMLPDGEFTGSFINCEAALHNKLTKYPGIGLPQRCVENLSAHVVLICGEVESTVTR
jgi:hypothetical protein